MGGASTQLSNLRKRNSHNVVLPTAKIARTVQAHDSHKKILFPKKIYGTGQYQRPKKIRERLTSKADKGRKKIEKG